MQKLLGLIHDCMNGLWMWYPSSLKFDLAVTDNEYNQLNISYIIIIALV